jgi:hypothetical protein
VECAFDAVNVKQNAGRQCAQNALLNIEDGTENGIQNILAISRRQANASGATAWRFREKTTAKSTTTTSANALQKAEKRKKIKRTAGA